MPKSKEFTVRLEDRPGDAGQVLQGVGGQSHQHHGVFGVSDAGTELCEADRRQSRECKNVLDAQKIKYTEADVAHIALPNRVGELARAASKLGDTNININYCYSGIDTSSNQPLVFFSVSDIEKALGILEEMAKAA